MTPRTPSPRKSNTCVPPLCISSETLTIPSTYQSSSPARDNSIYPPETPQQSLMAQSVFDVTPHTDINTNFVAIDILPDITGSPWAPVDFMSPNELKGAEGWSPLSAASQADESSHFQFPRQVNAVYPTVRFTSFNAISTDLFYSSYKIFLDGLCVHSEVTPLFVAATRETQANSTGDIFLYGTSFIPNYWNIIRESIGQYRCLFGITST